MKQLLVPLGSGLLFGAGLALGGMTDPARVRGFLDWFGVWDPTLAFVMAGATLVMAVAWLIHRRLTKPLLAERFFVPDRGRIDRRLVAGSALFGIGWGIAGLCPGPAVANLAFHPLAILPFLVAMIAGQALHCLVAEPR